MTVQIGSTSSNDDGSVNAQSSLTIGDRTILPQLSKLQPGGRNDVMARATSNSRNDSYALFMFAATYSSSEWGINHHNTNGTDSYTLGSFFDATQSPGYKTLGIDLSNVVSHMHSHPTPGVSDMESMGAWASGPHGDWANEIRRYNANGGKAPYYDAVYFPGSGRLYNTQASKGPVYIRNIENNYNRFFYGRL